MKGTRSAQFSLCSSVPDRLSGLYKSHSNLYFPVEFEIGSHLLLPRHKIG